VNTFGGFARRHYTSLGGLLADIRTILARRKEIRAMMKNETLDSAFRERLMLVVTGVNACRYCSYAHAREALAEGITRKEIEDLSEGTLVGSPPDQIPALLYAQHWAEADGNPDPEARRTVVERYSAQKVSIIELALHIIRIGNLSGNTLDYLLYKISGGRWGV
jgi:AhpD family alkylhydroperoxidase